MQGFIKLHRNILEWGWYDDINTKVLFLHILIKANYSGKEWRGYKIQRGELLTGRITLAKETGLTEQQVRTSLKKLISTNEITSKTTNKFSIIKVINYDEYQQNNQQDNQEVTNDQPTSNQQVTTTNNNNNTKKVKEVKHKYGEYKNVLLLDKELIKIKDDFGEDICNKFIKQLDEYIETKGAKYKNHNLVIRQWINRDKDKQKEKSQPNVQFGEYIRN